LFEVTKPLTAVVDRKHLKSNTTNVGLILG